MLRLILTTLCLLASSVSFAHDSPVKVVDVVSSEFSDRFEALGSTRAKQSVDLSSKVTGIVEQVYFIDGELVERGQLLLTINSREEQAELEIARLLAADHLRELNQLEGLKHTGASHQAEIDRRRTEYNVAVQRQKQRSAQLDDFEIRAPFNGLLGLGQLSEGALISPGDRIATIDSVQLMELEFTAPASWISSLASGQQLAVQADAFPEINFVATITALDTRIDPVARSIRVRASIDNEAGLLRPGLLMRVELNKGMRRSLMIPEAALVPRQNRQYVYVASDSLQAIEHEVLIGSRRPGEVEILEGLTEGMLIIYEGSHALRSGQKIRILGEDS